MSKYVNVSGPFLYLEKFKDSGALRIKLFRNNNFEIILVADVKNDNFVERGLILQGEKCSIEELFPFDIDFSEYKEYSIPNIPYSGVIALHSGKEYIKLESNKFYLLRAVSGIKFKAVSASNK